MAVFGAIATGISSIVTAFGDAKAKSAEAAARAEEARQRAQEKIAEQKRLQAQYEADSKERIQQMEMDHKKQEMELESKREKEKQEHEQRLQQMKDDKEKQDKELKIQQRDQSVIECKERIAKYKENIKESNDILKDKSDELNDKLEKISVLNEKIQNFHKEKEKHLIRVAIQSGLKQAKINLDRVQNEINSAIELTSVHEDNVAKFLSLVLNLVNTTIANQEKSNYLNAELNTFNELIKRAGNGKLSIEQYFEDSSMQRFTPMLASEDLTNMDDLKCEGNDQQDEYQEIMDLIETEMKKEHNKWESDKKTFENDEKNNGKTFDIDEPKIKLSLKHKRFFKKVCLKPETWIDEQKGKETLAKAILSDTAQPLTLFFNKINLTMKDARLMLSYNNNVNNWALTGEQQKAITSGDDNKMNETKEDATRMDIQLVSELDKQGQKEFKHSMALNKAAITSINVIKHMADEFEGSPHRKLALGIAMSIESTCMEIVRNIGQIRESIVLAHCILRMKPANLNGKSKKLWNAVDSGIIQIFKNALEMSKVAAQFFGFFAQFEQSFHYYLAAEGQSLMISTEHLRKDIKSFDKLTSNFNLQVRNLGTSALECIASCVKNTAGAQNYEKNRQDRRNKLDNYLTLKKQYDEEELKLDRDYSRMLDERADIKSKAESLKCLTQSLQSQIKHDRELVSATEATMRYLQEQVY